MKKYNKREYIFHSINLIVIFNIYLLYQTTLSQNSFMKYFKVKKLYQEKEEIYKKNNKELEAKIDLLNLSNPNIQEESDILVEFIKKNYDYREKNEKIIIIN